jgi:hypothetical protein
MNRASFERPANGQHYLARSRPAGSAAHHLVDGVREAPLPSRPWNLLNSISINVTLSKGESHSEHFFIHPKKAAGEKVLFLAVIRTLGHQEHVNQFKIERSVKAQS